MISKELLDKFRNGHCTPEEVAELRAYFQQGDPAELEAMLKTDWDETDTTAAIDPVVEERVWARLAKTTKPQPKIRRLPLTWRAVAAAILLLMAAGTGYWIFNPSDAQSSIIVEKYNESGEVQQITLADGSTIWLNRNSRIRYEKYFNDSIRAVTLTGEAFFEVAKNQEKPFIVKTGDVQTKVLGTAFNVRAFAHRETIEVALVEGKVDVGIVRDSTMITSQILKPGDLFAYRKSDQTYTKEQFEKDAPYAWRDGIIYFQRADVHEVAQTLEDWYDVTITIEQDSLIQGTLVHKFDATELTLEQALRGISLVSNYQFEPSGKGAYRIVPKQ